MFFIAIALGVYLGFSYMLLMGIIICILGLLFRRYPQIAVPIVVGFLIRLIMVFLIHNEIIYEGDWDGYISMAVRFSENGLKGVFDNFTTGAYFYSWLTSIFFLIFGVELTIFRIINAFLSTLIILNTYQIATNLFDKETAKTTTWIIALFPSAIIYSAFFCNREPLIIYFFTLSIYYLLKWLDNQKIKEFVVFFMFYALIIVLHSGFIFGLIIIIPYMLIKVIKSKDYLSIYVYFIVLFALSFVVFLTLSKGSIDKFSFGGFSILQKLSWFADASSAGRASYLSNLSINSYFDVIWQCPLRLICFLVTPFPWMIASIRDIYGFVDSIFYWFIIYCCFRYSNEIFKNQKAKFLFAVILIITISFAFATGNYGTALRHRAKFFPIYISIASKGIAYLKSKKKGFVKTINSVTTYNK